MDLFSFKVAYGDIDMEAYVSRMMHGSFKISIRKRSSDKGAYALASVINYAYIGWTVCFSGDDYFVFDPEQKKTRQFKGDSLTQDDKDAIMDRLIEAGII